MKKILAVILALALMLCCTAYACAEEPDPTSYSGNVMLYSSAGEDIVLALKEAFEEKYPNVTMDYYAATSGKCVTKLATEFQANAVACDVFWPADFSTTIAMSLQNIGQSMAPASHAAILLSLESVFGVAFSCLLLGETLTVRMVLGFAVIFVALIVSELAPRAKAQPSAGDVREKCAAR